MTWRLVLLFFAAALFLGSGVAHAQIPGRGEPPGVIAGTARAIPSCVDQIVKAELRYNLPQGLLLAISLVESGRKEPGSEAVTPWPYTINADGLGHFYNSVDEAMRDVAAYLARKDAFVDVGCMQVDLYHHPHAFATLMAAFDPETNVDYAAQYLLSLYRTHGDWGDAVAAYHAGTPGDGSAYLARVLFYWHENGTRVEKGSGHQGFALEPNPEAFDLAARLFVNRDYVLALSVYRAALAQRPDNAAALLGAAECEARLGREEDARGHYERALMAEPRSRPALDGLLRLIDNGAPGRRMQRLLAARQVAPRAPEIPARIAMIEAEKGNVSDAFGDLAQALRLNPTDPILLLDTALLLDRTGNQGAALKAYGQFLSNYHPETVTLNTPIERIRERYVYLASHVN